MSIQTALETSFIRMLSHPVENCFHFVGNMYVMFPASLFESFSVTREFTHILINIRFCIHDVNELRRF